MGFPKNIIHIFILVFVSSNFVNCDKNDTNGFYSLSFKLFCEKNCALDDESQKKTWQINDFKFQLYSDENPCNNRTSDVDESKISSIRNEIEEKWFRNATDLSINSIWKNSGSCSLRIPELNDELKYFKKALDLSERYSIDKFDMMRHQDIENLFTKGLDGRKPLFLREVYYNEFTQEIRLYPREIIFYLDKSFNPIDVDDIPISKQPIKDQLFNYINYSQI